MNKIDNTEKVLKFMEDDKTYLVMGIVRNKDNNVDKCKRHKFRYIINSKDQLVKKIKQIEHLSKLDPELEYRVYMSFNTRNVKNGLRNFQKLLLDYSFNLNEEVISSASRLDIRWFSELAKPTSSNKEFMLVDLDETSSEAQKEVEGFFDVVEKLPTKNGYHYIIERNERLNTYYKQSWKGTKFDYTLMKDSLVLVKIV